jgi:hypothetical protein
MQEGATNYATGRLESWHRFRPVYSNKERKTRKDFAIPNQLSPSVIIVFGYPASRLTGKRKNRLPIHELVYYEIYGESKKIDASKSPCS